MIDQQSVERAAERFRLPDGSFERLELRRDRKHRNQRIAAGVLGIAVFALAAIGFARLLGSEGTPANQPLPSPAPPTSGTMWPQTSMEELRQAQELADAGDPAYTWQVDPVLASRDPSGAEIFARFVEDELGWEASLGMTISDFGDVALIRCAPGATNPVYPNDPEGGGCAPTIDGFRYERVQIAVAQLVRQDATGIWVVTGWETMEPFEQVVPPSESETTALLEAFLQARVDGAGADEYVDAGPPDGDEIPFPYATPTGAPYERYEFEVAEGPLWPDGRMRFEVRLFAEGGLTVVEQFFRMDRVELGLWYEDETEALDAPAGPDASEGPGTTVNGQAVPVEYRFPDGGLTFHMSYPWTGSAENERFYLGSDEFDALLLLLGGQLPVLTGCMEPAPSDAQALARRIGSSPDLDVTPPVSVSVGGLPALRMDVSTAPGAKTCPPSVEPLLVVTDIPAFQEHRMRLYLVDLPPGSSARILAIAIGAPSATFDRAVEEAAPIIDSIEFDAR